MTITRITKEEREKQIIEVAKAVFIEKGYVGATTSELAKKANISEVTLYRYFSSKRDLFMAAIGPIMIDSLEDVLRDQQQSPRVLLEQFLTNRIEFIVKNSDLIKLMLIESEMNHELSNQVQIIEKIINMLKSLIIRIELPKEKRQILLRFIIGTFLSFLFLPIKKKEKIPTYVRDIMNYIEQNIFDFEGVSTHYYG